MYGLNPDINDIEATIPVEEAVDVVQDKLKDMYPMPDMTKRIENADNAAAFHDQRFGEGDDNG